MFCSNCGSKLDDGSLFCSVCGARVSQETESPAPMSPEKKKGKGKLAGIICGSIVAVACVSVGVLAATGKLGLLIKKYLSSPEDYFKYVCEKNTGETIDSLGVGYAKALESLELKDNMNRSLSMKLELGNEIQSLMGMANPSLKNIKDAEVVVATNANDQLQNIQMQAILNGTKLATINATADFENEKGYVQIPELSNAYIDVSDGIGKLGDELDKAQVQYNGNIKAIKDMLPDESIANTLLKKYVGVTYENVSKVEKSNETIAASGVEQKCTALKAELDGNYCYDTMADFVKELEKDDEIKKIIEKAGNEAYNEFKESLDVFSNKLSENKDNVIQSDIHVFLTLYVDNDANIIGVALSSDVNNQSIEVSSLMPQKGADFGYEMKVDTFETELFKIHGNGTLKHDVMNGKFSISLGEALVNQLMNNADSSIFSELNIDGNDIIEMEVKDYNVKEAKEGKFNGSFVYSSSIHPMIQNYKLGVTFTDTSKNKSASIVIYNGTSEMAKITLATGDGNRLDTLKPTENDRVYTLSEITSYLYEIDIEKFISSLSNAGLDINLQDIMNVLTYNYSGNNNYNDYSNYDDYSDYDDYDYDDYDDDYDDYNDYDDDYDDN